MALCKIKAISGMQTKGNADFPATYLSPRNFWTEESDNSFRKAQFDLIFSGIKATKQMLFAREWAKSDQLFVPNRSIPYLDVLILTQGYNQPTKQINCEDLTVRQVYGWPVVRDGNLIHCQFIALSIGKVS